MTSRERVLAAFSHEEPDLVPCWCGASADFWGKAKRELNLDDEALRLRLRDDFRRVFSMYTGRERSLTPGAVYRTPFGVERFGLGYGQPSSHPLAKASTKDLRGYAWPDPAKIDVANLRNDALRYKGQYAILGGEWAAYWHDAIDLVGMENLYFRMFDEPDFVDALLTHIVDFYAEGSRKTFEMAADVIDIFFIGNDFGSQTGPLLSEEMFRRFLLPHLKRLIDLGHDYRLKVMLLVSTASDYEYLEATCPKRHKRVIDEDY